MLFIVSYLAIIIDAKLVFVNVVHRHGDRTPEYVYPKDQYIESFWKEGLGILTNEGKNELYDLGKFMRNRYSDFLPLKYWDADVRVESSATSRTLMSAYCCLAGLYKPHGDDIWSSSIQNWQPIPVYTIPKFLDNKIMGLRPCPRYYQLWENVFEKQIPEGKKAKYKEVLKNISYHTGLDLNLNHDNLNAAAAVYDTLFVENFKNLKLPNWTIDYFPEPLRELTYLLHFELPYYNNGLKRFRCGQLLKEMIENFDRKINGNIKEKWWQYSGHDVTVADVLNCLNVYDAERPVYASAVFLELHQDSENNYDVALVYRKNKQTVQNLTMPNCTQHCPLKKFKELVKDVVPNDWDEDCKLD